MTVCTLSDVWNDEEDVILHDGKNSAELGIDSRDKILDVLSKREETTNSSQMDTSNDGLIARLLTRMDHLEEMNTNLNMTVRELRGRLTRRRRHIKEKYDYENENRSRSRSRSMNENVASEDEDESYF